MLYREAGQFKTSYAADQAIFAIPQDRIVFLLILAIAFLVIPVVASDYALLTIMIPFLVFALAAIGLNILTGYAGQLSLGTGGFMAVGPLAPPQTSLSLSTLHVVLLFLPLRHVT